MSKKAWTDEESALLERLVSEALESGGSLSDAFMSAAEAMGRKPTGVRSRWYSSRRGERAGIRRFSQEETEALVRGMLEQLLQGRSTRGAALALAGGDAALMLRYQNKFRSLVQKDPLLIGEIAKKHGLSPVPAIPSGSRGAELNTLRRLVSEQSMELDRRHERIVLLGNAVTRLCGLIEQLAALRGEEPPKELWEETEAASAGNMKQGC